MLGYASNVCFLSLILSGLCFSYELYSNRRHTKYVYSNGEKCVLIVDKNLLLSLRKYKEIVLPRRKFEAKFERCFRSQYQSPRALLIVPGTNWCGMGTVASHMNDYGRWTQVDKCCKAHDMCPFFVASKHCDFNMCNSWVHTISHCDCDQKFYDCLKSINSTGADIVGTIFFDVLRTSCFYERENSTKCPLINDSSATCNTNLKYMSYMSSRFIANHPIVRSVKEKFQRYLHMFY